MRALKITLLALVVSCLSASAEAGMQYGFWSISNTSATNSTAGANQLQVDVSDAGAGKVKFTFSNAGSKSLSITDIYFDNSVNVLTSLSSIQNPSSGVSFKTGASPNTLPYASNVGFFTSQSLNTESSTITSGVNQGESVGLTMNLASGRSYLDVLNAMANSSLRVGLYVRGFSNGGAESFVNNANNVGGVPIVPEPSSMALAGLAGVGLLFCRRKKTARASE